MAMRGSWGLAEMPVHLSALTRTREEDSATALGGVQGQLVEGEDLAPGLEDATPGAAAHSQSTHLQFGHLLNTNVISYSPHHHSCFALPARKLHFPDHPGKGERWPVGAAHEQSLEDNLIEGGVGSSGQEPVQLDQQPQVNVLALGLLASNLSVLVVADVNSLRETAKGAVSGDNQPQTHTENHLGKSLKTPWVSSHFFFFFKKRERVLILHSKLSAQHNDLNSTPINSIF